MTNTNTTNTTKHTKGQIEITQFDFADYDQGYDGGPIIGYDMEIKVWKDDVSFYLICRKYEFTFGWDSIADYLYQDKPELVEQYDDDLSEIPDDVIAEVAKEYLESCYDFEDSTFFNGEDLDGIKFIEDDEYRNTVYESVENDYCNFSNFRFLQHEDGTDEIDDIVDFVHKACEEKKAEYIADHPDYDEENDTDFEVDFEIDLDNERNVWVYETDNGFEIKVYKTPEGFSKIEYRDKLFTVDVGSDWKFERYELAA